MVSYILTLDVVNNKVPNNFDIITQMKLSMEKLGAESDESKNLILAMHMMSLLYDPEDVAIDFKTNVLKYEKLKQKPESKKLDG